MLQTSILSVTASALILCLYPIVKWTYNAFFHPLAKVPGPRSWAASRIPFLVSMLRGNMIHDTEKLHRQYGPILRIGPDEVTFAHTDAWIDILQPRSGQPQPIKDLLWWENPGGTSLLSAVDSPSHSRMRKTLAPGFTESALRAQEPIILRYVSLLIQRLGEIVDSNKQFSDRGATIDIFPWLNFTTFDIFGDLGFAESFNCLQNSEYHPWIARAFDSVKGAAFLAAVKHYPLFDWLLWRCIPPSLLKMRDDHFQFIADKLERRKNWEVERPDIIAHALKETKQGKGMSRPEVDTTFAILTIAGSETTATALGGIVNYLATNPHKRDILVEEIRTEFDSESDISVARATRLSYLRAVINEGLRLSPPIPWVLPRVVPAGGTRICGIWLPAGTKLSIGAYSLHRDPECFHLPTSFIPERWVSTEFERPGSPFCNDRRDAVQAFTIGPRSCLGKGLAWAEMQLVLAKLLWNFDISVADGEPLRWEDLRTFLLVEKKPIRILFKKKEYSD
ncbi:isotrichodermin C-15 hydroxylase [Lophiotrema nucula]|uniref:Isotrichodermin C-15 hydroxylase n=1 Tax=Lophiotrema nucula TaxID=690887 RepID=A0A6A5Z673_9PLEO|nr:isotrichodermin C-15 hydroxylase [Lophiotrema nucula]